jgi:hypothetical protein
LTAAGTLLTTEEVAAFLHVHRAPCSAWSNAASSPLFI